MRHFRPAPTPLPDIYSIDAKIGKDGELLGLDIKIYNDYRVKARYSEKIENGVKDVSFEQLVSKIKTALKDINTSHEKENQAS